MTAPLIVSTDIQQREAEKGVREILGKVYDNVTKLNSFPNEAPEPEVVTNRFWVTVFMLLFA